MGTFGSWRSVRRSVATPWAERPQRARLWQRPLALAASVGGVCWVWQALTEVHLHNARSDSAPALLTETSPKPESDPPPAPTAYYKYVIVGGGLAAHTAAAELARLDPSGSLLMVTDVESGAPASPMRREAWQARHRVYHCGAPLESLDVANETVQFRGHEPVRYGRLLLATGDTHELESSCAIGTDAERYFVPFGHLAHLDSFRTESDTRHITLIGGSWFACAEAYRIAAAATTTIATANRVTLLVEDAAPLACYLPKDAANSVTRQLRAVGVEVIPYASVRYITGRRRRQQQQQQSPSQRGAPVDEAEIYFARTFDRGIIASFRTDRFSFTPPQPRAGGARVLHPNAFVECDAESGGVMCNRELMAASNVYVAGDAATYPDARIGRRRARGYGHAVHSARVAARNMAGGRHAYLHQPSLHVRVGALEFVGVGDTDTGDETYMFTGSVATTGGRTDAAKANGGAEDSVVFYVRDRTSIVGALWIRNTVSMTSERVVDAPAEMTAAEVEAIRQRFAAALGTRVASYRGGTTVGDTLENMARDIMYVGSDAKTDRLRRRHAPGAGRITSRPNTRFT